MIAIKKLKFSNMFSYGENVEIEFNSRVTQLVGKNGSGKSSIPAILEDLFYNKTSRGVKKASIKNRNVEANWYSSECEFSIDSDEYLVSKRVTSKTELKLTKNGTEDLSGHTATQTYEILKNLLGMDFTTFTKLVYQSMLSNLDFLLATDGNRKKFLVSLLGLENYANIAEAVKAELSEVKKLLSEEEATIRALQSQMPDTIPEKKELVKVPDHDIYSIEKELEVINELNSSIASENVAIQHNNRAIKKLSELPNLDEPTQTSFSYDVAETKTRLTRELAVKESELRTLKEPATKCPTCGTPYNNEDHAEFIKNKKQELSDAIVQIKRDLEKASLDSLTIISEQTAQQEYEQNQALRAQLEESIDRSLPTEPQSTKPTTHLKDRIKECQKAVDEALAYNSTVNVHNAKVETLTTQKEKLTASIEVANTKVQNLRESKERLEVLSEAFGTKGLISYKIESMTKAFEGLINEYLTVFSDGRFNLVFQVEDTKLALKLYDDGDEIEIASLSSGEFNKVNTATLLAIRKMMVAVSKININILFLDEVVSVLDEESKDTLIEVLLNEKDLNSIVVSHGYNHPLTTTIKIINNNKLSEVINGE